MSSSPRVRAPGRHGEVVALPDFDAVPASIAENRRRLNVAHVAVDGVPLDRFRSLARQEVLALCESDDSGASHNSDGPLLLSGHQPELFHPGVWVKNFALHGLARAVNGIPINLIVDTDTLKLTSLRVPVFRDNEPKSVHVESIPFDVLSDETTYEDLRIRNPELFRSLPARVAEVTRNWGYEPLVQSVWREQRTLAGAFVSMRRDCERAWGCRNRELRVSRLSRTDAFGRFAQHILGDLPRFRDVYNAAVRRYRRENGIRSQSHPAPDLGPDEAPFWVHGNGPRRRATRDSNVRTLCPRALTLTLFVRLCLGDYFIHGIGGGKYDEVTDRIVRDYFGLEPPAFQVLSATVLLPLPAYPSTARDLERAERYIREFQWQPERHLSRDMAASPAVQQFVAEKEKLIRSEPPRNDHVARRQWFHALHNVTERLRSHVEPYFPGVNVAVRFIRNEIHANAILQRRDYAWVLYPEDLLKPFLQRFLR